MPKDVPMRMDLREMRTISQKFETREDGDELYIEGYFAVFNTEYQLWPGAVETIRPGAFSKCLGGDIRALTNHDSTLVLGRCKAGTLELKEDSHGLWGRVKINRADADAMNLYSRVQRGDVDQCSFGFCIEEELFTELPDGTVRWEIVTVNPLYEVSVCTFPAYEETSVSARKHEVEEIERRRLQRWKEEQRKKLGGSQNGN